MSELHNVNIQRIEPLATPKEYQEQLPIPDDVAKFITEGRDQIAQILKGEDNRLLLIIGPCSLHDVDGGEEYLVRLKELSEKFKDRLLIVMRVYFEKPRTTVGWKGLIYDPHLNGSSDITTGLTMAREFLIKVGEMGVLAATEIVDPITPQYIADLISWAAIGARTAESQTHRQMSSGLSMPVGFKNGTGGSIQLAVDGVVAARSNQAFIGVDENGRASMVVTEGNPNCHIVLRGGSNGPNFDSDSIADASQRLGRRELQTQLVVDCSHANCNKDFKLQRVAFLDLLEQRVAGNLDIVGMMLESNLLEGNQPLDESDPTNLKYGVSITDPCVGWDETVELITTAYEMLA